MLYWKNVPFVMMFGEGETRLASMQGIDFLTILGIRESKSKNIEQQAQEHLCNPTISSGSLCGAVKNI